MNPGASDVKLATVAWFPWIAIAGITGRKPSQDPDEMEELTMRVTGIIGAFVFDVNQFQPMVSSFAINSASSGGAGPVKKMAKRSKKNSVAGAAKNSVSAVGGALGGAMGGAMGAMGGALGGAMGGAMNAAQGRRKKTGKTSITQIPGMAGMAGGKPMQDADSGGGGASRVRRKKTRVD
jgi:hypothetical protein